MSAVPSIAPVEQSQFNRLGRGLEQEVERARSIRIDLAKIVERLLGSQPSVALAETSKSPSGGLDILEGYIADLRVVQEESEGSIRRLVEAGMSTG